MKRSTIALTIEDFGKTAVDIGRLAENKAVQVRVDLSKILLQEPKATASLVVESPSGDKYPAITRMEGKTLIWDVAAADVASAGKGKVQLNVIGTNGEVLKSVVAVTRIGHSLRGEGPAPDPVRNWVDDATNKLGSVVQAGKEAEKAASKATAAAETANESAEKAEDAAAAADTGETSRKEAETNRATAEQGRVDAEQGRVAAEQERASAETARETAEAARRAALGGLSFAVNSDDGGLDITYTYTETEG